MNVEINEKVARIALQAIQLRLLLCESVAVCNDAYTRIRNATLKGAIHHLEEALKTAEEANNANHPN